MILPKTYFAVWGILMALLLLTFGAAMLNLGPLSIVIALTIAMTKMVLIILYFMHVRVSSRLTWIFVGSGFVWFSIMLTLTLSDYLTRARPLQ